MVIPPKRSKSQVIWPATPESRTIFLPNIPFFPESKLPDLIPAPIPIWLTRIFLCHPFPHPIDGLRSISENRKISFSFREGVGIIAVSNSLFAGLGWKKKNHKKSHYRPRYYFIWRRFDEMCSGVILKPFKDNIGSFLG